MVVPEQENIFYNRDTSGSYPVKMVITSAGEDCKHENGWYGSVKFWGFVKSFFMCSDCGNVEEI